MTRHLVENKKENTKKENNENLNKDKSTQIEGKNNNEENLKNNQIIQNNQNNNNENKKEEIKENTEKNLNDRKDNNINEKKDNIKDENKENNIIENNNINKTNNVNNNSNINISEKNDINKDNNRNNNTTENKNNNNEDNKNELNKNDSLITAGYFELTNLINNQLTENSSFYIEVIIKKLSHLRSKGLFEIKEEEYKILLSLFASILEQNPKDDYILKNIIILCHTFYKFENNQKIYLQEGFRGRQIFNNPQTWHRVINYSMNLTVTDKDLNNLKKNEKETKDKINKESEVIIISYLCDIKQFTDNEKVFNDVKNYYVKLYNMDEKEVDDQIEQYVKKHVKGKTSEKPKTDKKKKEKDIYDTINTNKLDNENENRILTIDDIISGRSEDISLGIKTYMNHSNSFRNKKIKIIIDKVNNFEINERSSAYMLKYKEKKNNNIKIDKNINDIKIEKNDKKIEGNNNIKELEEKKDINEKKITNSESTDNNNVDEFIVIGNDLLGHGDSITNSDNKGYFGEPDPVSLLIQDIHTLRIMTQEKYENIPYFMLGHSMGSFFLRQYITKYGENLSGVILMGTSYIPSCATSIALKNSFISCLF